MDVKSLRGALTRLGLALGVALVAAKAGAAPVPPSVTVDIQALGGIYDQYTTTGDTTANADGTFGLSGIGYGTNFTCDWSIVVNPDPQITSTFTLTNLSASTQTFLMTITLPIAAIGPTTKQGGYFGDPSTGTVFTDTSRNGDVTLATVGANPFYQALVNGIASHGLGSFSSNVNTVSPPPVPLPPIFGTLAQDSWGTPIPSDPFGPASGNIQIKWMFSLTGGDQVSSKGFFQVEAPEPSSMLLIGLGLAGLAAARKRART